MSGLENLAAWNSAREFRKSISQITKRFPAEEKFRLTDQLIRASRSCAANIAEGYGRYHYQESIQFCRHARASLYECSEHLCCAFDEKYIDDDTFNQMKEQINNCVKILNGYILYLKNRKAGNSGNLMEDELDYKL